jgi:pSer/pThr/pTyr-binding forkhead associated (FHA) protein
MWKLTIEDDQASKTVVHLVRDDYTIGRAEENTVRLTERNISRRHARLTKPGERWLLLDMTSYNGCYVNGQRVNERHEIVHGDLVQLGDYRLQVLDDSIVEPATFDKAVTMPAAPRSQALLGQPDRLVMVAGPSVGAEYPLIQDHPLVMGRGEECDVPINHPSVSRVHAEVKPLGDGRYEIVDRESANGVRVNGVELPRTLLDARDVIELGDVILKFIPAGDIYVPGADESQQASAATLGGASFGAYAQPIPTLAKLSPGVKLAGIAGGIALVVALGVVLATHGGSPQPEIAGGSEPSDSAMRTLLDAKALLDKGDVDGAVRKAAEIPEASNARKTIEYRQIQGAWADSLFAKANAASDPAQKRALLDQIARATSVDSIRRKRAANELVGQGAESIDISDLPSAPKDPPKVASSPRPATAAPDDQNAAAADSKQVAAAKAATPTTLVRKNPFDDSPASAPASDQTAKLLQARASLQQKMQNGQATDRDLKMLRTLCQQLGDASCSN